MELERSGQVDHPTLTESSETYDLLQHAEILFKNRDFTAAVKVLHHVFLGGGHGINRALELMARSLFALGRGDSSLPFAKAWHRRERSSASALLMGRIFYSLDRDSAALEFLRASASLRPELNVDESGEVFRLLGNLALRAGDLDSASEHYGKVECLVGCDSVLLVNRGTLAINAGLWDEAAGHFRAAIQMNSNSDQAWTGLGLVHQQMGDLELAIANLERALDINPANRTALLLLVEWSLRERRIDLGIQRMKAYLDLRTDDTEIANQRAKFLIQAGRLAEARMELDRVLILDPEFTEAERLRDALVREQARDAAR
jgi:tetratricopeptide (TPR) repeat protein